MYPLLLLSTDGRTWDLRFGCKLTKLILRTRCHSYHRTSMRKSALIKRSMTQIPKAVHQSGTGEKTLEKLIYFRYKSINIANGLAFLHWNDDFVLTLLVVNLSLYQTLLIFLLMRSKLDSIDYSKSSVRGYILLIRKDSVTHVHSLAVCVKERLPFSLDLSLGVLIYFFNLPSFFVTLLFPLSTSVFFFGLSFSICFI